MEPSYSPENRSANFRIVELGHEACQVRRLPVQDFQHVGGAPGIVERHREEGGAPGPRLAGQAIDVG